MESSSIELKLLSCKDLKAFNFFQKLSVYAVVSIVSGDPDKNWDHNRQQRTPTDREGDGNPEWHHAMKLDLPEVLYQERDHLFVQFDLRHEGLWFGDKTIGEVRVPFKDLIQESDGAVRFVSYEIRTTDGRPNGVLNFSYKVNAKGQFAQTDSQLSRITGFPIVNHQSSHNQYSQSEGHKESTKIQYPSIRLEDISPVTYSTPQETKHSSFGTEYSSGLNYYPSLDTFSHQPALLPQPPAGPPHNADATCGYLPYPDWRPDPHVGVYGYSIYGPQVPLSGDEYLFDGRRRWPNGSQGGGDGHLSSWNGR